MNRRLFHWGMTMLAVLGLASASYGCGGSSGGGSTSLTSSTDISPPAARTVAGTLDAVSATQAAGLSTGEGLAAMVPTGTRVSIDNDSAGVPVGAGAHFEFMGVADGDHTLFVHLGTGENVEIPFRMLSGRGLNLGTVTIRNSRPEGMTGFDGYRFGFVDEDGDGENDLFVDADGDGICDNGKPYAGYPFLMDHGYVDGDGDGVNDRFRDADGDGVNDVNGMPYGHGFGFMDENADGINDWFMDANGDGICDITGMPFRHPFGYLDADNDGQNDRFRDHDGDGVNDQTGMPYVPMPGWVDLDGDGSNDFFQDADGDGINDLTGMPYGHGFGWADADHDGMNDRFGDADGDTVIDDQRGSHAGMPYRFGFLMPHPDANGNGIDDLTGGPYGHGFGWVDANMDGMNDAYHDADGDGFNDLTGHGYVMGFGHEDSTAGGHIHDPIDWPMQPPMHGGGGGMM